MNPQNGEILAMVNVPEFNLNTPYELNTEVAEEPLSDVELQERLNRMWRNECINDTYEPGSTFKIITSSACLEEGVVSLSDTFSCPGYRVVEDRRIRCHKVGGHGQETFIQGIQNSCNPVFIDIGLRLGADRFYEYFKQFGLLGLTNVDLPGEAGTIMHKRKISDWWNLQRCLSASLFRSHRFRWQRQSVPWSMVEKESRRILEFPLKTEKERYWNSFSMKRKKGSYQKKLQKPCGCF